jgi:hypothetical protein
MVSFKAVFMTSPIINIGNPAHRIPGMEVHGTGNAPSAVSATNQKIVPIMGLLLGLKNVTMLA